MCLSWVLEVGSIIIPSWLGELMDMLLSILLSKLRLLRTFSIMQPPTLDKWQKLCKPGRVFVGEIRSILDRETMQLMETILSGSKLWPIPKGCPSLLRILCTPLQVNNPTLSPCLVIIELLSRIGN